MQFYLQLQILSCQNREAMSVALAASLQFIRAEGFVFSHVADEGLIAKACAGDLLRYRDRGNSAQSVLSYLCEDAPHERWVDSQNVGIGIDSLKTVYQKSPLGFEIRA